MTLCNLGIGSRLSILYGGHCSSELSMLEATYQHQQQCLTDRSLLVHLEIKGAFLITDSKIPQSPYTFDFHLQPTIIIHQQIDSAGWNPGQDIGGCHRLQSLYQRSRCPRSFNSQKISPQARYMGGGHRRPRYRIRSRIGSNPRNHNVLPRCVDIHYVFTLAGHSTENISTLGNRNETYIKPHNYLYSLLDH